MRDLLKRNEFYVSITILALCFLIQSKSGQFFTGNNLIDLARSMIIPGILCMGVLIEIISGGIDVSFPAIAMLSMFSTVKILLYMDYQGPVIFAFVISGLIGLVLGAINGGLVALLRLPTLIITLGTGSIYLGFMQAVLKSRVISVLPEPISKLSKSYIYTAYNKEIGISSSLPTVFILLIITVILVYFILNRTMLGRGIYALGGDIIACERAGFNVARLQYFIYGFMGALAGVAGMTRTVLTGSCQPTTLIGFEMTCFAAVILGGTRITGGHGTVKGAILGALLITMVSNSLILLGVPTYWSKFVTGIIIIIGTGASAYQILRQKRKLNASVFED